MSKSKKIKIHINKVNNKRCKIQKNIHYCTIHAKNT